MVNRYRIRSFLKDNDSSGRQFTDVEKSIDLAMKYLEPIFKAVDEGNWRFARQREQDVPSLPAITFYAMNVAAGIRDAKTMVFFSLSEPIPKPRFMSDEAWNHFRASIDRESVASAFLKSLGSQRFLDVFRQHFHEETGQDHRSELMRQTSSLVHEEIGRCRIAGLHDRITDLGWPVIRAVAWTTLMATMAGREDVIERTSCMFPLLEFGIPVATSKENPKTWLMIIG